MTIEPPKRPDPDALVRQLREEEARSKRGKLKVFFGFAPGVGKTYRMLQLARDLVTDQGVDVVVGIVETHKRMETAMMTLGLELLPRKQVQYKGRVLEELDLDMALKRKPRVLLVDELAHTNAPGARHPKRWQDVVELLNAGIDVFTTVNVQHIESLNDVVSQITRIQVKETVPDSILDRADTVELVDIAPEELLVRLKEGKVYLPDKAERAAEHFFQRGNLLALRELSLLRTARHVDEDVLEYKQKHGVSATWPAGERILVCVGPAPSSGRLVRAAARMAAGLRCPWVAAYVELETLGHDVRKSLSQAATTDRDQLEVHLRVAESLGGTVTRLTGSRVSEAILGYSRRHNVTRILIGKPTHSWLRDRLRGSLLDEVVRGSGDIDVHVISGDGTPDPTQRRQNTTSKKWVLWHYAAAAVIVSMTTAITLFLRGLLNLPDPEMLFLLAVMGTAIRFGRGPSILSAALGVACYDFFFVPPHLTFDVADKRYFLTFGMMFGVGFVLSELTGRLKREEVAAVSREERTAVLYALSRDLASVDVAGQIAEAAAKHAASVFSAEALVLVADSSGVLVVCGQAGSARGAQPNGPLAPERGALDSKEHVVAKWAFEHGQLSGLGTDTLSGAASICAPLRSRSSVEGVLVLLPADEAALRVEQRTFLDVFCRQVAGSLERVRLADEARSSALKAKTEEMRSSLLSTVSHDFRTPLASITGAATSLRDDKNLSDETRTDLVGSICGEAVRLERLVVNLLDMTKLESGTLVLKRDWIPLDEVVGSALTRLEDRFQDRRVEVRLAENLPLVLVDPVLLEHLFVNLLENMLKYTPEGTPVEIEAQLEGSNVLIQVSDHGPGLPHGAEAKVFDKFFRGTHPGVSGAGLGLSICRGIVEAHGGTIAAENRSEGGARNVPAQPPVQGPRNVPAQPPVQGARNVPAQPPVQGARFRILLPLGGEPPAIPSMREVG